MKLPFTLVPDPPPRRTIARIGIDPDTNLSAHVRLTRRWTQPELARALHCTVGAVARWESGATPIPKHSFRKLLKLLPRAARLDYLKVPHRTRR